MYPYFSGNNIPVTTVAELMQKSPLYIRHLISKNILQIGAGYHVNGDYKNDYYISPYLFWKNTGIVVNQGDTFEKTMPVFSKTSITIDEAANAMKKQQEFIRAGLREHRLPFGFAAKNKASGRYNYYISAYQFWEYTGFVI